MTDQSTNAGSASAEAGSEAPTFTPLADIVETKDAVIMLLDTVAWAAVYAFDWPTWAGFGIVALPLIIIAVVLSMMGRSLLARDRIMPKSVDTLKENAEWIRARTQS